MTNTSITSHPAPRTGWLVPAGLLVLCLVPIVAGIWRLAQIAGSPAITTDNARFMADPLPAVVHIVSASLFCVLGAFQVARAPRARSLAWHRYAGRAVAPLGVIAGLSGVWLTLAYWTLTRDGPALFCMRLVAGGAMAIFVVIGVISVVRRDLGAHRAWMLRGYAIGIAAGTQFFTHLPWLLLKSEEEPSRLETTLAMGAGWLINIVVAELHLRRRQRDSVRPSTRAVTSLDDGSRPA